MFRKTRKSPINPQMRKKSNWSKAERKKKKTKHLIT